MQQTSAQSVQATDPHGHQSDGELFVRTTRSTVADLGFRQRLQIGDNRSIPLHARLQRADDGHARLDFSQRGD